MKSRYKPICKAIFRTAKETNVDFRKLMKSWIMVFEEARVVGWNRDEFLEEMLRVKEELELTKKQEDVCNINKKEKVVYCENILCKGHYKSYNAEDKDICKYINK